MGVVDCEGEFLEDVLVAEGGFLEAGFGGLVVGLGVLGGEGGKGERGRGGGRTFLW